jgi:hypothetical protein
MDEWTIRTGCLPLQKRADCVDVGGQRDRV